VGLSILAVRIAGFANSMLGATLLVRVMLGKRVEPYSTIFISQAGYLIIGTTKTSPSMEKMLLPTPLL
jgi:hypothetical protein